MLMADCKWPVYSPVRLRSTIGQPTLLSTIHTIMTLDLPGLLSFARDYQYREADLPIHFSAEPYTRVSIHRDDQIEIVVICFSSGQTSSVHDHQGSNCAIRVVRGKVMECLFARADGKLHMHAHHYVHTGEISGLDGEQIHQLSNLDPEGTVLLNFYSPPFKLK